MTMKNIINNMVITEITVKNKCPKKINKNKMKRKGYLLMNINRKKRLLNKKIKIYKKQFKNQKSYMKMIKNNKLNKLVNKKKRNQKKKLQIK